MEEIDGVCCHVECSGEGCGVVLLHGWGQNVSMMRLIQCQLQDRYRVLNFDLPGFGKSVPLKDTWNMEDYVPFLHHLLNKYQIENPIIIAHSFGARIAIAYAARYGVSCMVLTGAAGLRAPLTVYKRCKQVVYRGFRFLHLPFSMGSEDYRQADPIMKRVLVQAVNEDLRPLLPHIACPVLLVWGSEDHQTPLWMGKEMERAFPNAKLLVYQKEDHFAYYHQGFRFMEDVRQFLEVNGCAG